MKHVITLDITVIKTNRNLLIIRAKLIPLNIVVYESLHRNSNREKPFVLWNFACASPILFFITTLKEFLKNSDRYCTIAKKLANWKGPPYHKSR